MSYLVFARKFRPQTFDEVIGQEPITTTLKNAISKNRIAQSFLFTGSRGVGKTSTARIFAKALNCEKGPTITPCNQCTICQEITQGISLDILEIDGASNRGVDEIRNLRDNVKFKPARAKFKIYIIDEVHMLTGEAFNALLKTLEEPPEHVKFIFATTEVHKLPLTILSRCQRFNFRRIPTESLITKLKEIAKKEKIKIDDKALFLIAKSSEGSLRDGESLLDQLASFSAQGGSASGGGEGEIKEADVTFSLGLTDEGLFFSILEALKNKDAKSVLSAVQKISEEGKDLNQFVKGLLELFRNLLILKIGEQTDELIETTEEGLKSLKQLKNSFSKEELLFSLTLIQQLMREIRWSENPRFLIEACLLKITYRADLCSIDEMLNELKKKGNFSTTSGTGSSSLAGPVPRRHPEAKPKDLETGILRSAQNDKIESFSRPAISKSGSFTFDDVCRVWPELVDRVKSAKMSCGTYLAEALPVEVVDGFAVFGFPSHLKFHKEALEQQAHKELIRSSLSALIGTSANISFVIKENAQRPAELITPKPALSTVTQNETASTKEADIVNSALHLFGGSKIVHRD